MRDGRAVAHEHRPRRQDDRLPAGVVHGAERAGVALFAFDFDHARLQAELARRLRGCVALLARNRVVYDAEHGRTRERFARDLDTLGGELELAHENAGHVAPGTREVRHITLGERVEIDRQKPTRLIAQQRIDSNGGGAGQMTSQDARRQW